jgi:hypothetical protein
MSESWRTVLVPERLSALEATFLRDVKEVLKTRSAGEEESYWYGHQVPQSDRWAGW